MNSIRTYVSLLSRWVRARCRVVVMVFSFDQLGVNCSGSSVGGSTVTLGCQYESSGLTGTSLFWYKQDENNSPKFILSRVSGDQGETADEFKERFSSTLDSSIRSVPLKIQKLQLSDSAVYYCALQPTVTGNTKTLYKNLWRNTKTLYKNLWIELIQ
uniref:Ig-like domain-containing protein n=1 Tax=Oreochromis aureus TaxID=47969 RepID=A0AAZ1X4E9_OREAU